MNNTISELLNNLDAKIMGLGIDPKFKENPAYEVGLDLIADLISEMNMGYDVDKVRFVENEGVISFSWRSPSNELQKISIKRNDPNSFSCFKTVEKEIDSDTMRDTKGRPVKENEAIRTEVKLNPNGEVIITRNINKKDTFDCEYNEHNSSYSTEKMTYTEDGVMREREFLGNSTKNQHAIGSPSINYSLDKKIVNSNEYNIRELLVRDKLDTVREFYVDNSKGIRYSATTQLDQQHGLRDMYSSYGFPESISIPKLSPDAIEEMISREKNPKVAEGLRKFAVGRENYHYFSSEDKSFERKGLESIEKQAEAMVEEMAKNPTSQEPMTNGRQMGFVKVGALGIATAVVSIGIIVLGMMILK